jgi:hypothetical protein
VIEYNKVRDFYLVYGKKGLEIDEENKSADKQKNKQADTLFGLSFYHSCRAIGMAPDRRGR